MTEDEQLVVRALAFEGATPGHAELNRLVRFLMQEGILYTAPATEICRYLRLMRTP